MRAGSVKRGRRQSPFRAVCPKGTLRKQGVWAGGRAFAAAGRGPGRRPGLGRLVLRACQTPAPRPNTLLACR